MFDYLVDVPVKINIWIRPEMQRRQFEVIKKARPSKLFLISDGGRTPEEWEKIYQNRRMYDEEIDWDCNVYKLYQKTNLGMYATFKATEKLVWNHADRCIFMEDDIIPSVSYFQFCAELLERYKDDKRIFMICGVNALEVSENVNSDYFFSRYGAIQGVALWKRSYDQYHDFAYKEDSYILNLLDRRSKKYKEDREQIYSFAETGRYEGHIAGDEFFSAFANYGQNQVMIIPKKNLLCNIGYGSDASHGDSLKRLPRSVRKVYDMETYELDFPLKHANYVIPDEEYEKKRNWILGIGHPILRFFRKIERLWLVFVSGDIKYIFKKMLYKWKLKTGNTIEN